MLLCTQSKLQRMVQMSAALAAQAAALGALQAAGAKSTTVGADLVTSDTLRDTSGRTGGDGGSRNDDGNIGGGGKSNLASFLEFQQTLSQRYGETH